MTTHRMALFTEEQYNASPLIRRYYELGRYLDEGVDFMEMEYLYKVTPPTLRDITELGAAADHEENTARHAYEIIRSEASQRLRAVLIAGKEPSEARIDKLLPLEPEVQEARIALDLAKKIAQACTGLFRSFDTQSRLLGKAADLLNSGFVSKSAALDQHHTNVHEAKLAAERRRQEGYLDRPRN